MVVWTSGPAPATKPNNPATASGIAERREVTLRERDQADALPADVEAHGAGAGKMIGRSVAHLDLFDAAAALGVDRDREAERLVLREIAQAIEVTALLNSERRIVRMPEVVV